MVGGRFDFAYALSQPSSNWISCVTCTLTIDFGALHPYNADENIWLQDVCGLPVINGNGTVDTPWQDMSCSTNLKTQQ